MTFTLTIMCSLCTGDAVCRGASHNASSPRAPAGVAAWNEQRPARPRDGEPADMVTPAPAERAYPSDADLALRCTGGDREAFRVLAERYYRPVGAFLLKRVQRPDVVEDLAQETFLEAYRSLKAGTRPQFFSSWLFGIAVNRCGKWLRRKRPALFDATDPPDTAAVPSPAALQEEAEEQGRMLQSLEDGLAGLPEPTRELLSLKHRQGKTCEQIAADLGQPVGTIKSQLSRAYKALRERLGRRGEEKP
jgi:RNA polymerase sigma-70 factor (ECF subfamily)